MQGQCHNCTEKHLLRLRQYTELGLKNAIGLNATVGPQSVKDCSLEAKQSEYVQAGKIIFIFSINCSKFYFVQAFQMLLLLYISWFNFRLN